MDRSLAATIAAIAPPEEQAMRAAAERQDQLTKPRGALGQLEALNMQLAGITACARPRFDRRAIVVTLLALAALARHGLF